MSFTPACRMPEIAVGLHHAAGVRAGRDEHIEAIRMLILHALKERREIGDRPGRTHADFIDDFAALLSQTRS